MAKFGAQAAAETSARIARWKTIIQAHAKTLGFAPSLVAAIISRETAGLDVWCLPPSQGGKLGDNGFGHGPMQIDKRSFPAWCEYWRAGRYETADGIQQGCKVLAAKVRSISALVPEMPPNLRLRAAVAAYNCGEGNVRKAYRAKKDLDVYTANSNYSKDVMERAMYFASIGFDQ